MFVSGYSYGAYAPSIEMQRLSSLKGSRSYRVRKAFEEIASIVLEHVHPANFANLPPSPKAIVQKGVQIGLISSSDLVYDLTFS